MARTTIALTRKPGPNFPDGLTTHIGPPPDYAAALAQHKAYSAALRSIGIKIVELAADPAFPDGCFVEDTAVATAEIAVIARPGAESRRGETRTVRQALESMRPVVDISSPGTLDGGDVLMTDRDVFIGISKRTNRSGARQLAAHLAPLGYRCHDVSVPDGLHLKSSVSLVAEDTLLLTSAFQGNPAFGAYRRLVATDDEADACNTLWINGWVIMASGFPKTRELLELLGAPVITLEMGEFRKMDGGLSCLSVRL